MVPPIITTPSKRSRSLTTVTEDFFRGPPVLDRSSILQHPELSAFAFVVGDIIDILHFPDIHPDGSISGVLIHNYDKRVVSFDSTSFFNDCLFWIPKSLVSNKHSSDVFHVGTPLTSQAAGLVAHGVDADDADLAAFQTNPRPANFPPDDIDHPCIIGMPRVFPLFHDFSMRRGPLNAFPLPRLPTDAAIELWVRVFLQGLAVDKSFTELPGFSLALWPNEDADYGNCTCNPVLRYIEYPPTDPFYKQVLLKAYPPSLPSIQSLKRPLGTIQITQSPEPKRIANYIDPISKASVVAGSIQESDAINVKYKHLYANLVLLYSIVEHDGTRVIRARPPTLNRHFADGLKDTTKKEDLFTYVRRNFKSLCDKEYSRSKHHLCKLVKIKAFSPTQPLFNLLLHGKVMEKPFQEYSDSKDLATVVSLASFGPPMTSLHAYSEYQAHAERVKLDSIGEQHKEKAEAVQTRLFPFTRFDRSEQDVLTCVANFIAFSQTMFQLSWDESDPDNPTIIRMFLVLADLASSHQVSDTLAKAHSKRRDYIYHNLFLSFQTVFERACSLILSPDATSEALHSSIDQVNPREFAPFMLTYATILKDLTLIQETLSLCAERFQVCPDSWTSLGSGQFASKEEVPKPARFEPSLGPSKPLPRDTSGDKNKGWLILLDRTISPFDFKPKMTSRMCLYFAFQGYTCEKSSCVYPHVSGLRDLSTDDQEKVRSFIKDHSSVFALRTFKTGKPGGVSRIQISQD